MGRTPCCDSKVLKKGPWTPDEDKLLVDYVQANGSGNWRLLPKLAGTYVRLFCDRSGAAASRARGPVVLPFRFFCAVFAEARRVCAIDGCVQG
jgi:hypothetical protein